MFVAILKNETLSNAAHGQYLPPSGRTLYELSRLDTSRLQRWRG
jgi:hypothetical protein